MYGNSRQSWILDSTPWIADSQELDSSHCQWDLDSGFQSSEGLRIPWAAIPGIPSSKHLLDFGIWIPWKLSFSTICTVHTICKLFDWFSRLACLFRTTSLSLVVHSLCCLPLLRNFFTLSNFSSTLPSFSKIISNFGIMLPAMLKAFVISSIDWLPSESDRLPHFSFLSNGEKDSSSDEVEIIFFLVFLLELSAINENSKTQFTKTLHVRHLARPSPLLLSVSEKACIPRIY